NAEEADAQPPVAAGTGGAGRRRRIRDRERGLAGVIGLTRRPHLFPLGQPGGPPRVPADAGGPELAPGGTPEVRDQPDRAARNRERLRRLTPGAPRPGLPSRSSSWPWCTPWPPTAPLTAAPSACSLPAWASVPPLPGGSHGPAAGG